MEETALNNLIFSLLFVIWIWASYKAISSVLFPILTIGVRKKNQTIYNVPLIIDVFELSILLSILIVVCWAAFSPWEWNNLWWFPEVFIGLLLSVFSILSKMHGEIVIKDQGVLTLRKLKGETPKVFVLNKSKLSCYKARNNRSDITFAQFWKKWRRVHFIEINETLINLEEVGLENYAIDIIRKLKKVVGNDGIDSSINLFERYYGQRWIYTIIFLVTSLYIYINRDLLASLTW